MSKPKELLVPPGAQQDPRSAEIIRAWVAQGGLHCSLNIGVWRENEAIAWGIVLSDLARHVADALARQKGADPAATIAEIRQHFDQELDSPTSPTEGGFVE